MVSQKQLTGLLLQSMVGLMASQEPIPTFNIKVEVKDEPVLFPGFEIPPGFNAADKGRRRFLSDLPIPTFNVNKVGVKDEPVLLPGFQIPPGFTAADKGRRFLPYLPIPTFNVNKVGVKDEPVLLLGFEIPPGFTAADKGRRFLPNLPPSQPSSIEATPKSRPKKRNKPPASKMPRRSSRLQKIREATVGLRRSPRLQKIREAAIGPRRSMRLKEKRDRCSKLQVYTP